MPNPRYFPFKNNPVNLDDVKLGFSVYMQRDSGSFVPEKPALHFKTWPNPANSEVWFSFEQAVEVETVRLMDITGKTLVNTGYLGNTAKDRILLPTCSPGLYILQVKTTNGLLQQKLVIE